MSKDMALTLCVGALQLTAHSGGVSVPQRVLAGLRAYALAPLQAGSETLVGVFRITHTTLLVRPLYKSFASLLSTALLLAAAAALSEPLRARDTVVPLLAVLAAGHAARGLLQAQADRGLTPAAEARLSAAVAAAASLAAFALLLATRSSDAFGLDAAAVALAPQLAQLRGSPVGPRAAHAALAAPAALAAGALAGLLSAPGARWARCFALAAAPPRFMRASAAALGLPGGAAAAGQAALLRAAFLATALAAAQPLGAALLSRELAAVGWAGGGSWGWQAGLLAVSAAFHTAAFRPALQAYLDGALLTWHELTHSGRGGLAACLPPGGAGAAAAAAAPHLLRMVTEAKFEQTNKTLCKVAIQLAALPALQLAAAAVLLARRPEVTSPEPLVLPSELWRALAHFLGWWAGASWLASASAMLVGLRSGLFKV